MIRLCIGKWEINCRTDCDPSYFSEFVTSAFKKVFKDSSKKKVHKELIQIQKKLNICSNATIKKFVLLIEDLSKKFPHGASHFSWKKCFDLEDPQGFCPDKMKIALKEFPEDKTTLIEILNGKHFIRLKPGELMIQVLNIFGHAIDPKFDRKVLSEFYDFQLVRLERFSGFECNF